MCCSARIHRTKSRVAQVEAMLDAAPPGGSDSKARTEAILAVDELVASPKVVNDPEIIAWYQRQFEKGLQALESGPPEQGVRVVKFYSLSVVMQTKDACFTFDFCEGPSTEKKHLPAEQDLNPDFRNFHPTDGQRKRLANIIDAYFISHLHGDHLSYVLIDKMTAQGKPVIGPAQMKAMWKEEGAPFADKLPEFKPHVVHELGPITFRFYSGAQYMDWYDGEACTAPVYQSALHRETNCYLLRVSGLTFAHFGENQDWNIRRWAEACRDAGWDVDIITSLGMGVPPELLTLWDATSIAGHEYEYTHPEPNRYLCWLGDNPEEIIRTGKPWIILFWGEHLDLPDKS